MVSCVQCTARFSATPAIEADWLVMHDRRFHAPSEAATGARAAGFEPLEAVRRFHFRPVPHRAGPTHRLSA